MSYSSNCIELRESSNTEGMDVSDHTDVQVAQAAQRPAAADGLSRAGQGRAALAEQTYPRRWLMLPVVLIAMFMAGFDIWAVNVAAPSLQQDLHVSDAALQLIVGGYAFMYATGMITGGRLGDLLGYRRLFMIGVASFALASLLCGLAQSPTE